MASRSARPGRCPPTGGGRAGPGTARPALTRTEMLRQAKSAAVVQKAPREAAATRTGTRAAGAAAAGGAGCPGPRRSLARVGPPPADPKKVDFKRPGLTKAMQMRQKAAAEKIARDEEAKRKIEEAKKRPRRTAAPVGGDARMGRERPPPPASRAAAAGEAAAGMMTPRITRLQDAISRGHVSTRRGGVVDAAAAEAALEEAVARGHIVTDRRGARPKRTRPDATSTSRRGGPAPSAATATSPIPGGAQKLARSMNAKIVQAVPLSDGPVDKIIIEPGVVSEDRNTIVCISRPAGGDSSSGLAGTSIANRSVQAISETLDEQDAAEAAAVQGKLEELQHARREFVIAVANVGNNAVGIAEEAEDDDYDDLSILDIDAMPEPFEEYVIPRPPPPSTPPRRIVNLPDVSHEMFQLEYGQDHPDVVAAREFSRRVQASMEQRAAERRMQEGFAAQAAQQPIDDLRFDVPFEQDIMEGDYSFEEDEEGHMVPCPSRIKASMPPIPVRQKTPCDAQAPITIEELQRFMDLENYPPSPRTPAAPPGREHLHPDLWELEDPWYFEEQPPADGCDLMRFDDSY